jgi:hypothetical protein
MSRITALASVLEEETPAAQELLADTLAMMNSLVAQGSYGAAASLSSTVEETLYRLRVYAEVATLIHETEEVSEEQRFAMVLDRIGLLSMEAKRSTALFRLLATLAAV